MGHIELEKQNNARDLGGIKTAEGYRVRPLRLIRSGRLSELTNGDAAMLLGAYHLRTVIDLRGQKEMREYPDPSWGIVEYHTLSLLDDEQLGFNRESQKPVLDALIEITCRQGYSPKQYMIDCYRTLITNRSSQLGFQGFFKLLLEQREGAVLYHCNGGKDRTGLCTVLLLTALNVPWHVIADDYLATSDYLKRPLEKMIAELPMDYQNGEAKAVLTMMYQADGAYLRAAREEMTRLGGNPMGYLQNVIGITENEIAELREKYLESSN